MSGIFSANSRKHGFRKRNVFWSFIGQPIRVSDQGLFRILIVVVKSASESAFLTVFNLRLWLADQWENEKKLRRKNVNISSRRIQPPTHCNDDYTIEIGLRQWKHCVLPDLLTGTYDNYFSDGSTHQVRAGLSVEPWCNFFLGIQRCFQNSH